MKSVLALMLLASCHLMWGQTCGGCTSPIVIDVSGKGFHFTSPQDGVLFDMTGDGTVERIGWPTVESGNAFLALDRNHDGAINSGRELFGNYTAQPKSSDPNGYLALAEFDKPEHGGNGDGIIDDHDAVFSHLRLWIDKNHDGISQPDELFKLSELGVFSIGLEYRQTEVHLPSLNCAPSGSEERRTEPERSSPEADYAIFNTTLPKFFRSSRRR